MKRNNVIIRFFLLTAALSLILTSCSFNRVIINMHEIPDATLEYTSDINKNERIQLNMYSYSMNCGDFFNIIAYVFSDDDISPTFKSSDTSVVTVTAQGRVTAISEGQADVIVSAGSLQEICRVTVSNELPTTAVPTGTITAIPTETEDPIPTGTGEILPEEIKISGISSSLTLSVGEKIELNAKVYPENAPQDIIWILSNQRVASLDTENGILKATYAPNDNGTGYAVVTAMSADGSVSKSFDLVVLQRAKSITIRNTNTTLKLGEEMRIDYTYSPGNSYKVSAVFSSSDTSVATVSSGGRITAVGEGTATIRTAYDFNKSVYDEITITVISDITDEDDNDIVEGGDEGGDNIENEDSSDGGNGTENNDVNENNGDGDSTEVNVPMDEILPSENQLHNDNQKDDNGET